MRSHYFKIKKRCEFVDFVKKIARNEEEINIDEYNYFDFAFPMDKKLKTEFYKEKAILKIKKKPNYTSTHGKFKIGHIIQFDARWRKLNIAEILGFCDEKIYVLCDYVLFLIVDDENSKIKLIM